MSNIKIYLNSHKNNYGYYFGKTFSIFFSSFLEISISKGLPQVPIWKYKGQGRFLVSTNLNWTLENAVKCREQI